MTRQEQLIFCKKCINRKMDTQQGLLCGLTGNKANFTNECPDFKRDETINNANNFDPSDQQPISAVLSSGEFEKLRMEQNLPIAIAAGVVVGLLGAFLWGIITMTTGYQIGYMSIAIGAAVGFSMRHLGKGIDQVFGISGGIISVLSCILGNFLTIIAYISEAEGLDFFETLLSYDYSYFIPLMTETFSFMDIIFYGIAGYEGYKFAFRVFTDDDLSSL